jgi:Fic family protein
MKYNWQQKDWPTFHYVFSEIEDLLFEFTERVGRVSGLLKGLSQDNQSDAILNIMVSEAIKTSEIEGEYLSRKDVVSSIRNNLGLGYPEVHVKDKRAEGIAELMLDVRNHYANALHVETLQNWHSMLFRGNNAVTVGQWRAHTEPMQVISGAMGKEKIHFEAPPSDRVPSEMNHFVKWFNQTGPGGAKEIKQPVIRSAVAHLYFESIHPFEDGNGRIGRAISEKALSQSIKRPVLLSLSKAIESNKKRYYQMLEKSQQSNEITAWIKYFVETTLEAQKQAEELIEFTLKKANFFDLYKDQLNPRQLKVVRRMLEEGPKGFEGGMTAKKYIAIAKASKATATRDLQNLVEKQALVPKGGGRSTRYELNFSS